MIEIVFNILDFQNDIGPLTRAFFPLEKVEIRTLEQPAIEADKRLDVSLFPGEGAKLVWDGTKPKEAQIPWSDERVELKNRIKRALYHILSEETGKKLPWGALTGIRPVKLALGALTEGKSEDEIERLLREEYLVSDKKIKTALSVAKKEERLLCGIDRNETYSLYLGIPFCPSICLYCSFASSPISEFKERVKAYVEALKYELSAAAEMMSNKHLVSVYFGGGTPTSLSAEALSDIMGHIINSFDLSYLSEWTVEAGRPDSIDKDKLLAIKEKWEAAGRGIGRLSINPQTMNQKTLDLIGRRHTTEDIYRAFETARDIGIDNINTDIILGLPEETMEDVGHTADEIVGLAPDNLTIHSLAMKSKSRLSLQWEKWQNYTYANGDEIMSLAQGAAEKMGMEPYYLYRQKNMAGNLENTGYALPGKEGLYNMLIMEQWHDIMAVGAGAASRMMYYSEKMKSWQSKRCENVKNIDEYIKRIEEMTERKRMIFLK